MRRLPFRRGRAYLPWGQEPLQGWRQRLQDDKEGRIVREIDSLATLYSSNKIQSVINSRQIH